MRRVVMAVASVLVAGVPLVASGPAVGASTSVCASETASRVGSALGLKVTKETKVVQGSVTVCWYQVGANSHAAFVRVQAHDTLAGYKLDLKNAATYGEHPKADSSFSPAPAFDTSVGAATYGYTYGVTVLKSGVEVAVGGAGTTLSRLRGMAKAVLALT
ncbi:MAG: hypothetical protein KGJ36_00100 [Acidobacteriota bacterium]|nr:hypothetical protein [Acidobacteriota bacterium]